MAKAVRQALQNPNPEWLREVLANEPGQAWHPNQERGTSASAPAAGSAEEAAPISPMAEMELDAESVATMQSLAYPETNTSLEEWQQILQHER